MKTKKTFLVLLTLVSAISLIFMFFPSIFIPYPKDEEFVLEASYNKSKLKTGELLEVDCKLTNNSNKNCYIEYEFGNPISYTFEGDTIQIDYSDLVILTGNINKGETIHRKIELTPTIEGKYVLIIKANFTVYAFDKSWDKRDYNYKNEYLIEVS